MPGAPSSTSSSSEQRIKPRRIGDHKTQIGARLRRPFFRRAHVLFEQMRDGKPRPHRRAMTPNGMDGSPFRPQADGGIEALCAPPTEIDDRPPPGGLTAKYRSKASGRASETHVNIAGQRKSANTAPSLRSTSGNTQRAKRSGRGPSTEAPSPRSAR